ncbi:MAG: hypothetical protein ACYTDW_05665 [Planctomycetota bacterium]|jgi:hypothetical protein
MSIRNWINNHPKTILCGTILSLLALAMVFVVVQQRRKVRRRLVTRIRSRPKRISPVVKGKLIFERVPIEVKELSGYKHPLEGRGNTVKCGDSLDVMWFKGVVLCMKKKGLFERMLAAEGGHFSDLEWDGQNIWIGIPRKGIWLLDTFGKVVAKIDLESGLPPSEKGLFLHPIEPGRFLAIGSFGPYGRGWCATVEFKNGQASVNVFHEATRVLGGAKTEEVRSSPFIVFTPYWIRERRVNDRRILYIARCENRFGRKHVLRFPLEIDLDDLTVRVSKLEMLSIGRDSPRLEYNGKIYVPGRVWYSIDPNTGKRETLVTQGRLPDPYGSLGAFWVSAHYGLVGWKGARELYRITVTDEERVIFKKQPAKQTVKQPAKKREYLHTFAFEDANGPITDPNALRSVRLGIYRKEILVRQFKYPDYAQKGNFPLGSYKAWQEVKDAKTGKITKKDIFLPLQVTEKSPEHLVFKFKPPGYDQTICCGQVVDAITGKPMAGAFVMAGLEKNLAEVMAEEWEVMHKLPVKPSVNHPVLEPLSYMSPWPIKKVVRTDSNGRFEMSFKRKGKLPYEFVAFEENYLSAAIIRPYFSSPKDGRMEIGLMPLFPAAKVRIYPCIEIYNKGKPCHEASQVNVFLRVAREGIENSREASIFFSRYGGYSGGVQTPTSRSEMNQTTSFYVPAGFSHRLEFDLPYDQGWIIPDIPREINLKQGETFDLGKYVFLPRLKLSVKVLTSTGYPIERVRVKNLSRKNSVYTNVLTTDKKGVVPLYVQLNSKQEILFDFSNIYANMRRTLLLDVGSKEDAGKGFTVVLLETGKIELLKTLDPKESELAALQQAPKQPNDINTPADSKFNWFVYATALDSNSFPRNNISKISINRGRIFLFASFQLSLEYHDIIFKLFDESGKLLLQHRSSGAIYTTRCGVWKRYDIKKDRDKPGKWKTEIYLDGKKMGEKYLTVLP